MSDKELTTQEHNSNLWKEIQALEAKIAELKTQMKPVELEPQADLNYCNELARKAKIAATVVNPKLVAEESGIKTMK